MEKVIRDGLVAVLYSPGFGAGWSTWAEDKLKETALFHPKFVAWVEGGKVGDIENIAKEVCGEEYFYLGGADQLTIEWLPVGTAFRIDEYDGSERVETIGQVNWSIA